MRKIIWNILVVLAVINLIWLFVFNYKIPRLPFLSSGQKEAVKSETVEEPLPVEEVAEEAEDPEAETEVTPDSEETAAAAEEEETESEAEAASVGEEIAETEAGEPEEENPETEDDGLRRCRINDGYNARIRSGPGMDYDIVTERESGSLLVITGDMEDGWYPVRSEDGAVEGYIYSDLVHFSEIEE